MRCSGTPARVEPDLPGLVVGLVHRDPQPLGVDPEDLGQQLPREGDGVGLEVVAEAEVPEHLEERAVALGGADDLDVDGAEALLHRRGPGPGRDLLAQEVGLERDHAGDGEQHGGVVGDEAGRRDDHVPALRVEAGERRAELVGVHHRTILPALRRSPGTRRSGGSGLSACQFRAAQPDRRSRAARSCHRSSSAPLRLGPAGVHGVAHPVERCPAGCAPRSRRARGHAPSGRTRRDSRSRRRRVHTVPPTPSAAPAASHSGRRITAAPFRGGAGVDRRARRGRRRRGAPRASPGSCGVGPPGPRCPAWPLLARHGCPRRGARRSAAARCRAPCRRRGSSPPGWRRRDRRGARRSPPSPTRPRPSRARRRRAPSRWRPGRPRPGRRAPGAPSRARSSSTARPSSRTRRPSTTTTPTSTTEATAAAMAATSAATLVGGHGRRHPTAPCPDYGCADAHHGPGQRRCSPWSRRTRRRCRRRRRSRRRDATSQ